MSAAAPAIQVLCLEVQEQNAKSTVWFRFMDSSTVLYLYIFLISSYYMLLLVTVHLVTISKKMLEGGTTQGGLCKICKGGG